MPLILDWNVAYGVRYYWLLCSVVEENFFMYYCLFLQFITFDLQLIKFDH